MQKKVIRIYVLVCSICVFLLPAYQLAAQQSSQGSKSLGKKGFLASLRNTHDMLLPSWGPYSDKFNGISHVPAENNGMRLDVAVQPSLYLRNLTPLANVKRESGYHPWQATADLSYFSYRFELEWKDRVYADVSFSRVDEQSRLIKAEFVNNTTSNRSLALNMFTTLIFPYQRSVKAVLPDGAIWHKGADYVSFTDSVKSWNYNLVYNGQLRGQQKDEDAVSGTSISTGSRAGGRLHYRLSNGRNLSQVVVGLRYRTNSAVDAAVQLSFAGKQIRNIQLPQAKEYSLVLIELGDLPKGAIDLSLKMTSGTSIRVDGLVVLKKGEADKLRFENAKINHVPKQLAGGVANSVVLKYDDLSGYYGLLWSDSGADLRELWDDNPDQLLFGFNNLVKHGKGFENTKIRGNTRGWFLNVFSAPIILGPGQRTSRYAYVVSGSSEREVVDKLKLWNANWQRAEVLHGQQRAKLDPKGHNAGGGKYQFSQQLMQATTLTNLIYPTFTANQYTTHTTPGKKWSSLYTWDSGFIGLGYSAISLDRAIESLNAYTMDATEQSAFLEHGTPLPVQGYLFNELWNRTQDTAYLKYYYPRLKRFYGYLGGAESSSTRGLKSGLIKTWDIFYNSGGWDDYSPQVYVHQKKLSSSVAPTINTAHQIRFAKMLRMAAWQLGYTADVNGYTDDIAAYAQALQKYAWDEPSGYYGYVEHDPNGNPTGILGYPGGGNFNMGLDGCSPLIAGICTPDQQKQIIGHLFTKGQLWTDQGITAIDQSAPYYNSEGYWNGRVWMPHQWFFWKTMLDLNQADRALQIAVTALDVWKRETEDSYNCWENFSNQTGNGGGWHQFGALSSPVLNWYGSLFKQGTVTHGFSLWPIEQRFGEDNQSFSGKFKLFADQKSTKATILLCLNDKYEYQAKSKGGSVSLRKLLDGLYAATVDLGKEKLGIFSLVVARK